MIDLQAEGLVSPLLLGEGGIDKEGEGMRPKILTPNQVRLGINRYFKSITITRTMMESVVDGKDDDREIRYKQVPRLNNLGKPIEYLEYVEHPSLGKLALFLGIHRETLLNYSKDPEYFDTIKEARQKIENYLEDELYRNGTVTGIIFNLKNNFGWKDKSEVEVSSSNKLEDFFMSDEE